MPKVVALQSITGKLAKRLQEQHYKIIDIHDSARPGTHVDIILCTGYHPDAASLGSSLTEPAHISLGRASHSAAGGSPLMLNITGLNPEQVADHLNSYHVSPNH